MPAGRPLKFKTVKELDAKIEDYFATIPETKWTWTGLAIHLDTDKWTLHNYVDRPEFSASIKKALLKVENGYEIDLKKYGRSGTIFALKNFDWKDKTEVDQTIKGSLSLTDLFTKASE
jgi:hypothetical protein